MEEKVETKKNETHTHASDKLAVKEEKKPADAHAVAAKEAKEAPAKKADAIQKDASAKKPDAVIPAAKDAKPADANKAKEGKKQAKAEKEDKDEKKREIVLERVCIVPLVKAYKVSKTRRLQVAVKLVREYAARHSKSPIAKVKLATSVNEYVRAFGSSHIHKKIKIRLTKDKEGGVLAELTK
ncbi:MAG: hypothetical protein WC408_03910 [Candidatus Micrarchaeia archaeon]